MRTDIDHLPGQKQQELKAAVRILFEEFVAAISEAAPKMTGQDLTLM